MFWHKKKLKSKLYIEPVISEFESARLDVDGVWCRIDIHIMPNGKWFSWRHDIPKDLINEAIDALKMLAYKRLNPNN